MSIVFRLERIEVTDFRGVRTAELSFLDQTATYLIGANNAGKSTLVNALALALRGGGMHLFKPGSFDFFHAGDGSSATTFSITLRFAPVSPNGLPAVQGVGNPTFVHAIRVEGKTNKKGEHSHSHVLLDEDDKKITFSRATSLKGATKDTFAGHDVGWRPVNARPTDIYQVLPEVWLLTPDNLYKSLYEWRTGPLHRLSKMLSEKFLETKWDLEYEGRKHQMPATIGKMHEFFRAAVMDFPFWKDDLKPKLESALGDYVGRQAKVALQPDIKTIQEWLTQQLQASFAADAGGPLTPLDRMGQGWQSLVRLAALDVISKYPEQTRDKVVLLFEEPETYLHPHLRRKLRNVLDRLASQGWYIICSTHAPEFISFASSQSVVRLWREGDNVVTGSVSTSAVSQEAKFQEKLDEYGNHEMLFCNRVVLCEGKDDVYAIRTYLEKAGVDLEGRSVTILGVGGVENLPEYARMAGALHIPWCAITDEDLLQDGTIKPATKDVRDKLGKQLQAADTMIEWPGCLETALGKSEGKAKPEWQRQNIEPKGLGDLQADIPTFVAAAEKVKTWIERRPGPPAAS